MSPEHVVVDIQAGNKHETLAAFARQFSFPGYFAYTWDALNDCINDLEWYPHDSILVRLDTTRSTLTPADHRSLIELLDLAKLSWAAIGDKQFDYVVVPGATT